MKQVTLVVTGPLMTMNQHRRAHFHVQSAHGKEWRQSAKVLAQQTKVPHFDRALLTITPHQCKGALADPSAHAPSAKAAIDGLVDAGVLDDDNGTYVAGITFLPVEKCKGGDWLTIVITEAAEVVA